MKRKLLKRKTGLKRTTLRRVSAKLSKELKRYYVLRDRFLKQKKVCEICGSMATEVHHKKGRGKYLNDVSTWMAVERICHQMIHNSTIRAREMGWLLT